MGSYLDRPVTAAARISRTVVILALLPLLLQATFAGAVAPSEIISRHGIRPVDPPTPASDFTLPSLSGERLSLSDLHGSWVLLTFFATWCGPCRSEMPSLERLNQQMLGNGLVVLGISVDQQQQGVAGFVDKLGLSFPVLWDERGEVARTYRASSIPLSYLIDPAGNLVGVSRGARDWAELVPMVEELLAEIPPDSDLPPAYAAAGSGPVELPSTVEPPTAEIALLDEQPFTVNKPFTLEVKLIWAGSFEEYLPQPPQVHLPEGVERRQVTASTSSRDGRSVVTYRLELSAAEPGSYALDPVELRYVTRYESQPLSSRLLGPTVQVKRVTIAGLTPLIFGLIALGVVAIGAVAALLLVRRSRTGKRRDSGQDDDRYSALRARFDEARARRLQGDPAGFVLAMAELDRQLGGDHGEPLPDNLGEMVEQARYGGQAPPPEELDKWQRRVERRLEIMRPDPEKNEREAIRLAEDTGDPDTGAKSPSGS